MGLLNDPYNPVNTNPYVTSAYGGGIAAGDNSPAPPVMNDPANGLIREPGPQPAATGGVLSGKTLSDTTQSAGPGPYWRDLDSAHQPPLGQQPENPAGPDLSSLH